MKTGNSATRTKKIKSIDLIIDALCTGKKLTHYCSTTLGGQKFVASSKVINPIYDYSAVNIVAKQIAMYINKTAFDSSEKSKVSKKLSDDVRKFIDWSSSADGVEMLEVKFRCNIKVIYLYLGHFLFFKFPRTKKVKTGYIDVTAILQSGVVSNIDVHMTKQGNQYMMRYGHGRV